MQQLAHGAVIVVQTPARERSDDAPARQPDAVGAVLPPAGHEAAGHEAAGHDAAGAPERAEPVHDVQVVDHHRFCQAVCSCGWVGAARRARSLARDEAADHAHLHAPGPPDDAVPPAAVPPAHPAG